MNRSSFVLKAASAAAALFAAGGVSAALCTGVNVGTASTSDVTLDAVDSTACVITSGNAGQGGGVMGVDLVNTAFGSNPTWTVLANGDTSGVTDSFTLSGVKFDFEFNLGTKSWSLETDRSVAADFVFALHGGHRSGLFLFDDKALGAEQSGTWKINFVNNGGSNPGYSNVTLFARNVTFDVPEPSSYALALCGLAALGAVRLAPRWRRRGRA